MFAFIALVVIGVIGIGCLIVPAWQPRLAGGLCVALAALVIPFGLMLQTVPAQSIGIVLSGGQPTGEVGAGWQWIAPWQDLVLMDNSVQVVDYQVADPSSGSCQILVRIANQQTACAEVKLRLQPQPAAVDTLFRQYGNTAAVITGLVTPAVQNAANQEFQGYDPIADVNSTLAIGSPGRPSVQQIAAKIQSDVQTALGTQVKIDKLTIPNIDYDSSVQAELNAAFTQKAKTVIAEQAVQTAQEQADANRVLAASVARTGPLVLVQECLNWLNVLAEKGVVPTMGASGCWPGAGSGVVIPASGG